MSETSDDVPEPPEEAFVPDVERVFVTGGSGFIGRRMLKRLVDGGVAVRSLARSDSSAETVERIGAEAVRGDLSETEAMERGMEECDLVVHAAALLDEWGSREQFAEVNVRGTERVLRAARSAGVERLVHVGTEAVCVEGHPLHQIDEFHPIADPPVSPYAWSKAEAERTVVEADSEELETVVVRPRFVWGAGDRSLLPGLIEAVETGRFAWISGGTYETSTTHVENAVEGILRGAAVGRAGEVYFVTDGEPVEYRTFVTALLGSQGVEVPSRSVPRSLVRPVALLCETLWRALGIESTPPITRTATDLLGVEVTIDDSKARRELGYAPIVSRQEGLEELEERGGVR